jgi:hypothetical protein
MIAFLSTRFRLIEDYSVKLSDLLNVEKYSENADIVRFLPDTPADQSTLTLEKPQPNKSSVAQVLRTRPSVLQVLQMFRI